MAIQKGSRYENAGTFDPATGGRKSFRGVKPRLPRPGPPAVEHLLTKTERLDALGHSYYAEPRLWYRLAEINTEAFFPEDLLRTPEKPGEAETGNERVGQRILIPGARE